MSLNFTIDNIISTYFIEKNKNYSFVIYHNNDFNFFNYVEKFICKILLNPEIKNIPLFIILTTDMSKSEMNSDKNIIYLCIKNLSELNIFFDKLLFRQSVYDKYTKNKILIFIDNYIVENFFNIYEPSNNIKYILHNDTCLHVQLAIITDNYNNIKVLNKEFNLKIYKILM